MTQFGAWVTNKPVPFQRHRYATATEMQEGVVDAGDYKVAQNSGGANMSVDVAIGKAWLQIDSGARNGLAFAFSDAQEDPAIAASNATNPRIDQVVLQYNDTSIPAGVGGDIPTVRVIAGVPTAGATLDNRSGAAALPNDCVRLADILVPAASVTVVTANIRDRRPWARGAYRRIAVVAGDYTVNNTAYAADLDATNLKPRVECSGAPLRLKMEGMTFNAATGDRVALKFREDGVNDVLPDASLPRSTAFNQTCTYLVDHLPAAGSHTYPVWAFSSAVGGVVRANAVLPFQITVEEVIRQNADNT